MPIIGKHHVHPYSNAILGSTSTARLFQAYFAAKIPVSRFVAKTWPAFRGLWRESGIQAGCRGRFAKARQLMSQKETLLTSAAAGVCDARAAARTQRRIAILPIRKEGAATQRSGGGQDRLKRSLMNSGSHPEAVLGSGAVARCSTTTRRSTSPFR